MNDTNNTPNSFAHVAAMVGAKAAHVWKVLHEVETCKLSGKRGEIRFTMADIARRTGLLPEVLPALAVELIVAGYARMSDGKYLKAM